jgi:hypothetical protein
MIIRDFGPYGIILSGYIFWLVHWLVGWLMNIRDFGTYRLVFMNACYNCCHDNAVKGFWALRDNI